MENNVPVKQKELGEISLVTPVRRCVECKMRTTREENCPMCQQHVTVDICEVYNTRIFNIFEDKPAHCTVEQNIIRPLGKGQAQPVTVQSAEKGVGFTIPKPQ